MLESSIMTLPMHYMSLCPCEYTRMTVLLVGTKRYCMSFLQATGHKAGAQASKNLLGTRLHWSRGMELKPRLEEHPSFLTLATQACLRARVTDPRHTWIPPFRVRRTCNRGPPSSPGLFQTLFDRSRIIRRLRPMPFHIQSWPAN
jgi:hypothetical protein